MCIVQLGLLRNLRAVTEQPRHHRRRIPFSLRPPDAFDGFSDACFLLLAQLKIDRADVLLEILNSLGSRNRDKVLAGRLVSIVTRLALHWEPTLAPAPKPATTVLPCILSWPRCLPAFGPTSGSLQNGHR